MTITTCLAAVVLLLDVSGSVGAANYDAQRDGTAAGFEDARVVRAIETGGGVAVALAEFSLAATTRLDWRIIVDEATSRRFAAEVRALRRSSAGMITALGDAIEHGRVLLRDPPCMPERRVIDVSTDGHAMDGTLRPAQARDAATADGIEINAIAFAPHDDFDPAELTAIQAWLRANVATGFVRVSLGPDAYAESFRHKLITEIALRE